MFFGDLGLATLSSHVPPSPSFSLFCPHTNPPQPHSPPTMSQSNYNNKPENALKRGQELMSIGQTDAALGLLHEVLLARKYKTWSLTYEAIMIYFLDICIEAKPPRPREVKDGLHQYRNMSQTAAPNSLEKVVNYLVAKSEALVAAAVMRSDGLSATEGGVSNDLESAATPESIMLSTMSSDYESTQSSRTHILPALRFLWEVYRAVLDILKTNSRLEKTYHATANRAFTFCATYARKTEFRRLCDMLRIHLNHLQRFGSSAAVIAQNVNKVKGWEGWTLESVEFHLSTRFAQLSVASTLEQYSEGFRTVEDIYAIMQISKKQPKAKIMATYFDKLTKIFWVSKNYLFHAYAWFRFYGLCREFNKNMNATTVETQGSCVLLAALCIPRDAKGDSKSSTSLSSGGEDELVMEKNVRMATLLGFNTSPSRESLINELVGNQGVLNSVPAYLKELYECLEETTDPLNIVSTALPLLAQVKDNEETAIYYDAIKHVLVLKLLVLMSNVYKTISVAKLMGICEPIGIKFSELETVICAAVKAKSIAVRIDHREGCLRFSDKDLESDSLRRQLSVLGQSLEIIKREIVPVDAAAQEEKRARFFAEVKGNAESENKRALARKDEIERKKEEHERSVQEAAASAKEKKEEAKEKEKREDALRLKKEEKNREREKQQKIQDELEIQKKKQYLQKLGKNLDQYEVADLAKIDADALVKEHSDKAQKKKDDAERRLKEQAKKLDYITRAVRIEELPRLQKVREDSLRTHRENFDKDIQHRLSSSQTKWEKDSEEKKIYEPVFGFMESWEAQIMEHRKQAHAVALEEAKARNLQEAIDAKNARGKKRMEDEIRKVREEKEAAILAEQMKVEAAVAAEAMLKEKAAARAEAEHRDSANRERDSWSTVPQRGPTQSNLAFGAGETRAAVGTGGYVPPAQRGGGQGAFVPSAKAGGYDLGTSRGSAELPPPPPAGGDKFSNAFGGGGGSKYVPPSQRGGGGGWRSGN